MGWKAEHHRIYEARVVTDSLARLAKRIDPESLPFSEEELRLLAKRARQWFRAYGSEEKRERLSRYKAHLAALHGEASVDPVWAALEQINNEIGYEEK
jgi:lysyl-tRNA synthetase class I